MSPLLSNAIPDGPLNCSELMTSTGAMALVPVSANWVAVYTMTALLPGSVIQAFPDVSITACRGVFKLEDVMIATGSGELSLAREDSCEALNSSRAGVAAPLMLAAGSSTHRLPL